MELKIISISNYRSIDKLDFEIEPIEYSKTYALLGINESGKSSFLKAISILDREGLNYPLDYFEESEPVEIILYYHLTDYEIKDLEEHLSTEFKFEKSLLSKVLITQIKIVSTYEPSEDADMIIEEVIEFKQSIFSNYTVDEKIPRKKESNGEDAEDLNLIDFFKEFLPDYFWRISHNIIFWKSSPQYLIIDEIDLLSFSVNPKKVSIPLYNCFYLAGLKNIEKEITKLSKPVAIQNLEERLSNKVTAHINKIWPEHPVKIKFKINSGKLTFLVEDKGVKFQNKTTNQRSDGFRQLISFLLTLSAENVSEELSHTILLLDEPETHLHPQAQLNLKNELIKLSQNKNNNIVFFATHSSYMIDQVHIERCYKVFKEKNSRTKLEKIKKHISSYSEINYEVFEIPTNDYHNELYGFLEDVHADKLKGLIKNKRWINKKTNKTEEVSLATYIRHSIHHPENNLNIKFTDKELKMSIDILRKLKYNNQV